MRRSVCEAEYNLLLLLLLLLIPHFSHEAQSAYNQIQKQIINTYM